MKIYGKLLSGIGVVVFALLAAIAGIVLQAAQVIQFKDFANDAAALVQKWDAVQLAAQGILLSPELPDSLQRRFAESAVAFQEAAISVAEDPRLISLGKDVNGRVSNMQSIWKLTQDQIDAAGKAYDAFKENVVPKHPSLRGATTDGLAGEMARLDKEGRLSFVETYYFSSFKTSLRTIMLANDSFKSVLSDMDAAIEAQVQAFVARTVAVGAAVVLAIVAGAFFYVNAFARKLSRRARSIEASMRLVAKRDFTVVPEKLGSDEIGMLSSHLAEVIRSLGTFFAAVRDAASNVVGLKDALSAGTTQSAAAVAEINKNIESIKARFSVLDSAIDQASSALGDIGRYLSGLSEEAVKQTSSMESAGRELAESMRELAEVSRSLSDRARNADDLKRTVADGSERVQATNAVIGTIARDIEGVAEIVELIDQISEQTNILSMNAAIESAHAGAAGKGFAVVAEEIRKLAESTQENSQRIGETLDDIMRKIAEAQDASEASSRSLDAINAEFSGFVADLEGISQKASASSAESQRVVTVIQDSIGATKRIGTGTAEMYEKHRAIQDAMENIQAISDETLGGITEIDAGSKEILESVVHVEEISTQSRERAAELESALSGFKIGNACGDAEGGTPEAGPSPADPAQVEELPAFADDERGVAVKKPPKAFFGRAARGKGEAVELKTGDVEAEARLLP